MDPLWPTMSPKHSGPENRAGRVNDAAGQPLYARSSHLMSLSYDFPGPQMTRKNWDPVRASDGGRFTPSTNAILVT